MKITMNIEAGCPTGSTRDWTDGITIEIDSSLARDFVGNIMEYARQEAKADHWQISDSYIVRVTYETTVQGYNADDIEEAIWVGDYEIGKLPDGTEIRADAEDVEVVEA
tara:strand:+ start:1931 stop:2257 length:327 start_codon:yes stop_codon:yes gene_type:complete